MSGASSSKGTKPSGLGLDEAEYAAFEAMVVEVPLSEMSGIMLTTLLELCNDLFATSRTATGLSRHLTSRKVARMTPQHLKFTAKTGYVAGLVNVRFVSPSADEAAFESACSLLRLVSAERLGLTLRELSEDDFTSTLRGVLESRSASSLKAQPPGLSKGTGRQGDKDGGGGQAGRTKETPHEARRRVARDELSSYRGFPKKQREGCRYGKFFILRLVEVPAYQRKFQELATEVLDQLFPARLQTSASEPPQAPPPGEQSAATATPTQMPPPADRVTPQGGDQEMPDAEGGGDAVEAVRSTSVVDSSSAVLTNTPGSAIAPQQAHVLASIMGTSPSLSHQATTPMTPASQPPAQ
uniref:Uncharacterized protein n=1 Tax=Pyramimonas obovata TaxID=1411642 RepID=A0A7S0R6S0_9CHLO|mmetsp:Transcript_27122/g.59262  ORF Transcript_27122/g.59262 Transcript_27122/m.59262 type:complete len:354 (+) Transcript_27122:261-1322(+)|eukprot:CAMPEP_0118920764 /NCGR_PEP_ID=MMETSP1169-20130426/193_1 /TAXON_ID=36882 /ORGANISM="Pyramimonas obovata, Strain CCMP722" /LENGTH=353 /DNA_ID=CAMNT_0006861345 /DNA_START=218 /DNA_END=1279 /DNA_ORIENTATION=+